MNGRQRLLNELLTVLKGLNLSPRGTHFNGWWLVPSTEGFVIFGEDIDPMLVWIGDEITDNRVPPAFPLRDFVNMVRALAA